VLDEYRKNKNLSDFDRADWMRSFLIGLIQKHPETIKADGGFWLTTGELYA